jgi:cytochrome c553
MRILLTWRRALLALAAAAGLALLVAWAGLVPIAASSGHWAVTEWALHWVMRNAIRTAALPVAVPDLTDPALLARGAGHYATGCAPCHGAPGQAQTPIAQRMSPPPPAFAQGIADWTPAQLFVITRDGVKFTGMPAWPGLPREEEVWSLVAFLRALPALDEADYQRLATGGVAPAAGLPPLGQAVADCARCHGPDGAGRPGSAAFPLLGGQSETYLRQALEAFARGERHSGFMQPAVASLPPATIAQLAAHYAAQPPAQGTPPAPRPAAALVARGAAIAREGLPAEGVPACLSCHGAAARARNPAFPRLDFQHQGYLANQLAQWRGGTRGGGPQAGPMAVIAGRLPEEAAAAAAAWFAAGGEMAPP